MEVFLVSWPGYRLFRCQKHDCFIFQSLRKKNHFRSGQVTDFLKKHPYIITRNLRMAVPFGNQIMTKKKFHLFF